MANKKTVLIVDDEADCRTIVETVVSEVGDFRILTATDGEAAYALCLKETPDLAIMDVVMPGMDGFSLFRELRKREATKNVPIIMVTGISEVTGVKFTAEGMGKFLGSKPVAFLDKPVDLKALADAIRSALKV